MTSLIALVLAAATAQAPAPPPQGAQVSVRATAEIVRADTSSLDAGENGAKRHVRRRPDGQIAVEFE